MRYPPKPLNHLQIKKPIIDILIIGLKLSHSTGRRILLGSLSGIPLKFANSCLQRDLPLVEYYCPPVRKLEKFLKSLFTLLHIYEI